MGVCDVPTCPAMAVDGSGLCAVHCAVVRRLEGGEPIHCYACGELIRIGSRYLVRAEGAFHLRTKCLHANAVDWKIQVMA